MGLVLRLTPDRQPLNPKQTFVGGFRELHKHDGEQCVLWNYAELPSRVEWTASMEYFPGYRRRGYPYDSEEPRHEDLCGDRQNTPIGGELFRKVFGSNVGDVIMLQS